MVFFKTDRAALMAVLLVPAALVSTAFGGDEAAGVVRIRSSRPSTGVTRIRDTANSATSLRTVSRDVVYRAQSPDVVMGSCNQCGNGTGGFGSFACGPSTQTNGCWLIGFGSYDIVYAADPNYFDSRDGRVYSAQGYGIPMSVPLAPNVEHAYSYGWGIPSSRLTPISRPGCR